MLPLGLTKMLKMLVDSTTPENKVACSIDVDGHDIYLFFHFVISAFLSTLPMDSPELVTIRVFNFIKWSLGSVLVHGVFCISCLMIL